MLRADAVWVAEQPRATVRGLAEHLSREPTSTPDYCLTRQPITAKSSSTRAAPASKGLVRGFAKKINAEFGGHCPGKRLISSCLFGGGPESLEVLSRERIRKPGGI